EFEIVGKVAHAVPGDLPRLVRAGRDLDMKQRNVHIEQIAIGLCAGQQGQFAEGVSQGGREIDDDIGRRCGAERVERVQRVGPSYHVPEDDEQIVGVGDVERQVVLEVEKPLGRGGV